MNELEKVETVFPIDPQGKYVLILPETVGADGAERVRMALRSWMANDETFLILAGHIRLEKVGARE